MLSGTLVAQLLALATVPFLSRIYTPQEYGILAVYASCLNILSIAVTMNSEWVLQFPREDTDAFQLVCSSLFIITLICSFVLLIIVFFGKWLVLLLGTGNDLIAGLWLLPASLFFSGSYQMLTFWALRKGVFSNIAVGRVVQVFGISMSQIILGLINGSGKGLLIGDVFGRLIGSLYLLFQSKLNIVSYLSEIDLKKMVKLTKSYLFFSASLTLAALFNNVPSSVTTILMTAFFGTETGGLYALAQLVVNVPVTICHQTVGYVFVSNFSKVLEQSPHQSRRLLYQTLLGLSILSLPLLLISIWGPELFEFVLGKNWREAGCYGQILTIYSFGAIIGGTVYPTLTLVKRQITQMAWGASRCLIILSVVFLSYFCGYGPSVVAMVYSLTMTFFYVLYICISLAATDSPSTRTKDLVTNSF